MMLRILGSALNKRYVPSRIPIGDYSTFNLLKTSAFLFFLEASGTMRRNVRDGEFGLSRCRTNFPKIPLFFIQRGKR
jgi:hypothetical protein